MENNKVNSIHELLDKASTFSGYDIPSYTEEKFKEIFKKEAEQDFIRVQDDKGILYIPKNLTGAGKEGTYQDITDDMYIGAYRHYSSRGIKFDDLKRKDIALLKETFGDMFTEIELKGGKVNGLLFTHIDKKNVVERVVDGTFAAAGTAVGVPAALADGVALLVFSNPLTAVVGLQVGVAATVAGALGTVASGALAGIPKALDFIKDKLNGDERKVAFEFAARKIELENEGKSINFESELHLNKGKILERIKNTQDSFADNKTENTNKVKLN